MLTKSKKLIIFAAICVLFLVVSISYPYKLKAAFDGKLSVTQEEFDAISRGTVFCTTNISRVHAKTDDELLDEYLVEYKLFNLFNITNLRVNVIANNEIYAGGNCLGFKIISKGLVVVGSNYVIGPNGAENPFTKSELKIGDLLTHIDNVEICNIDDIDDYLSNFNGGQVNLSVIRQGETKVVSFTPILDAQSNKYKLGLWLKSDASGVGTLTFVNKSTSRYGALGHAITNSANQLFDVSGGNIYNANVVGVKRGQAGNPGELIGIFNTTNEQGTIDKNTNFGVFGNVAEDNDLSNNKEQINVGGRLTVKPGKAQILTTIDGYNIETFDVEIIKTNFQNSAQEKSMIIRINDKRLLEKTGGIVQGMSGSPIIQNGKLVGAVTHVFVNDPTKGFGIYLDWMLDL